MVIIMVFSLVLPLFFAIWFIASVQDFLSLQRKKLRLFEEMLKFQKETNELLRFIVSTRREDE
jgi:hypothetical protein